MSLLFELRAAARQATEITIEYSGGDPVELVALAEQIGQRENCIVDRTTPPGRPHILSVCFARRGQQDPSGRRTGLYLQQQLVDESLALAACPAPALRRS